MRRVTDWLLEKMDLGTDYEGDMDCIIDKCSATADAKIECKNITSISDAKMTIDKFKSGSICIITFNQNVKNPQEIMNYICGAMYALDGDVQTVGYNTFALRHV